MDDEMGVSVHWRQKRVTVGVFGSDTQDVLKPFYQLTSRHLVWQLLGIEAGACLGRL